MFGLRLITPPAGESIDLATAKAYCRVESDITLEDQLFQSLWIPAARKYVEKWLDCCLVSQEWRATFDRFPTLFWIGSWGNSYQDYQGYQGPSQGAGQGNWQWTLDGKTFRWPFWPFQQMTKFSYLDINGTTQQLPTTNVQASVAAGAQTVTPDSMAGIQPLGILTVDRDGLQEDVTVTAVSATTFSAVFAQPHTGPFTVTGYTVASNKKPTLICPCYGIAWPIARAQYDAVAIQAIAGYGPVTTSPNAITAGVNQVVTPTSMFGIYLNTVLNIEPGTINEESVAVTAITPTTFTATFQKNHGAGVIIGPNLPQQIKTAMLMLIDHWFTHRSVVELGTISKELELSVKELLYSEWSGEVVV